MTFEVFPWNEWIRMLVAGDETHFFNGLRRAVYGYKFLRGKRADEIRREYGEDVKEDIFQTVALKTLQVLDTLGGSLTDDQIGAFIMTIIRNEVSDCYRRRLRENMIFRTTDYLADGGHDSADSAWRDTLDLRPSPETELIRKQFIDSIYKLLTPRQQFILNNYKSFGLGSWSGKTLAEKYDVSVKTIEKDVASIRHKIKAFAVHSEYLNLDEHTSATSNGGISDTVLETAGPIISASHMENGD